MQTAQARANGVSVAGRRIRVSMAKPRNTGTRHRFIADRRSGVSTSRIPIGLQIIIIISGDRCTRY